MQSQNIPLSKIKNNLGQIPGLPKNPRTIKDEKYEKLKQSLIDDPEMLQLRELLVIPFGTYYVAIAGNMRLKAMRELGYTEAPCKVLDPETPVEKLKAYTIKDNISYGADDWQLLKQDWDLEQLSEWGMDIHQEEDEAGEPEAQEDDYEMDEADELEQIDHGIEFGDFFQIGPHRLLVGDSTKVEYWQKLFGDAMARLFVTDPPYNVDYQGGTGMKIMNDKMGDSAFYQFLLDFYTAASTVTMPGGGWYVWHADSEGANFRRAMNDSGLMVKQCIIWVKNALVMGRQDYQWKHEPCLYGWKPGAAHYFTESRSLTTVMEDQPLDIDKMKKEDMVKLLKKITAEEIATTVTRHNKPTKNDIHPTMKPVPLIADQIKNSSKKGDIVGDGFLGSGTTMVAAHQLGRICYGQEMDPKYAFAIVERMSQLDTSLEITKNGKHYDPAFYRAKSLK